MPNASIEPGAGMSTSDAPSKNPELIPIEGLRKLTSTATQLAAAGIGELKNCLCQVVTSLSKTIRRGSKLNGVLKLLAVS